MSIARLTPEVAGRFVVDPEPWLSCDHCFHLVDRYVDDLVSATPGFDPDLGRAMDSHLRGCMACREEAAGLLELAAADRGLDPAALLATLPSA